MNTLRLGELEPVTWFLAGHQSHPFESLTSQFFIIFPDSGVTGWHWFHIFSELVPLNWYSIKPAKATRILTPKASKFMAFGDSTYYLIGTVNYKHFFIRLASDRVWQICPFWRGTNPQIKLEADSNHPGNFCLNASGGHMENMWILFSIGFPVSASHLSSNGGTELPTPKRPQTSTRQTFGTFRVARGAGWNPHPPLWSGCGERRWAKSQSRRVYFLCEKNIPSHNWSSWKVDVFMMYFQKWKWGFPLLGVSLLAGGYHLSINYFVAVSFTICNIL